MKTTKQFILMDKEAAKLLNFYKKRPRKDLRKNSKAYLKQKELMREDEVFILALFGQKL